MCVIDAVKDAVEGARDAANDLIVEPVHNVVERMRETVADAAERGHDHVDTVLDSYTETMELLGIHTPEEFTEKAVDRLTARFVQRLHCRVGLGGLVKRAAPCANTLVSH